jgi:ParB-like chromosome segregation protein Spo0J
MGTYASPRQHDGTQHDRDMTTDGRPVSVPLLSIQPGDSPRLNGEDKAHIVRLAETETDLPPILVDRQTMKVVDGMHRLMAASLQGHEMIEVIFFDGKNAADTFLRAVEENVTHGLPLSHADRRAAAERIIGSHPQMSDRAIGRSTGLGTKTVAAIRRRLSGDAPQLDARVGRDGKVRPLDSGDGRRRAAKLLTEQPASSLREVAMAAGISPSTVLDVRKRLERGESPVPVRPDAHPDNDPCTAEADPKASDTGAKADASRRGGLPSPALTVEKLLRDPSLRSSEGGRQMLRLLHLTAAGADQLPCMTANVPPHCVPMVAQVARQYAQMWQTFATEMSRRALVVDPVGRF